MTLSDIARAEAIDVALRRMREDLADHWIAEVRFAVNSDRFSDLPQTTWLDMQEQMWVVPMNYFGDPGFKLTGQGLVAAMQRTGELQSSDHKDRCVRLRSALKDVVKGRELQGGLTDTYELAAKTGLADSWILNAIDARFLAREWPTDSVDVDCRHGGREIRVSAQFGTRRLFGLEAGPILPIPDP